MILTTGQLQAIKADIAANGDLAALPNTSDGNQAVANLYNVTAVPAFWGWRTRVSQLEIVTATSQDGTNWSWPDFIARSVAERDGWREMFADGGTVNAALTNVRQGFADIFSGAGGANQRAHLLAMGRRQLSRIEKLLATGAGSTAAPATMGAEGPMSSNDVLNARNS